MRPNLILCPISPLKRCILLFYAVHGLGNLFTQNNLRTTWFVMSSWCVAHKSARDSVQSLKNLFSRPPQLCCLRRHLGAAKSTGQTSLRAASPARENNFSGKTVSAGKQENSFSTAFDLACKEQIQQTTETAGKTLKRYVGQAGRRAFKPLTASNLRRSARRRRKQKNVHYNPKRTSNI